MKIEYWSGAHTKHRLMIHIVWIPKYRKRILKGALAIRIKELLEECADVHRWKIEELNIQLDHVHIVVQFRPDVSVSKMVQMFKGKSSRKVRAEFPELEEFYWGDSFWADGFFAETTGRVDLATIKDYVKNQ
ncbi:MAG: IS200/IS605 family transposase [bacterium]